MGYEIDFLAVGDESRSGDAIALRYGDLNGPRSAQTVVVIDGGFTDTGTTLVEHIKKYFRTDHVEVVVSTHPEQDHITGLETVLKELSVGNLLMHLPWRHEAALAQARAMVAKSASLGEALNKSVEAARELERIASGKNITIVEPFAGVKTGDNVFRVLGPTKAFYEQQLGRFPSAASATSAPPPRSVVEQAMKAAGLLRQATETFDRETLEDGSTTTPQNDSSVISLLTVDGHRCLFTGDAGIPALSAALDSLGAGAWKPSELEFIQVPHHGSHHNVGPTILDRLLGPRRTAERCGAAYVSAARLNPDNKHPSRKVSNAFLRRGYPVYATSGRSITHSRGQVPARPDYDTELTPLPLFAEVEE